MLNISCWYVEFVVIFDWWRHRARFGSSITCHLFKKELFIRFTVRVFRALLSNFVCVLLSLRMRVVIVFSPDHYLSIH